VQEDHVVLSEIDGSLDWSVSDQYSDPRLALLELLPVMKASALREEGFLTFCPACSWLTPGYCNSDYSDLDPGHVLALS
jgi:hypothetical protein